MRRLRERRHACRHDGVKRLCEKPPANVGRESQPTPAEKEGCPSGPADKSPREPAEDIWIFHPPLLTSEWPLKVALAVIYSNTRPVRVDVHQPAPRAMRPISPNYV